MLLSLAKRRCLASHPSHNASGHVNRLVRWQDHRQRTHFPIRKGKLPENRQPVRETFRTVP